MTDAISALGLHEGIHRIGELEMEVKNNCAYILGTNTLCGSMLPLNGCVRLLHEYTRELIMDKSLNLTETSISTSR